mgnify:CR=1 FL=1
MTSSFDVRTYLLNHDSALVAMEMEQSWRVLFRQHSTETALCSTVKVPTSQDTAGIHKLKAI